VFDQLAHVGAVLHAKAKAAETKVHQVAQQQAPNSSSRYVRLPAHLCMSSRRRQQDATHTATASSRSRGPHSSSSSSSQRQRQGGLSEAAASRHLGTMQG
jgi:hypothetical protein